MAKRSIRVRVVCYCFNVFVTFVLAEAVFVGLGSCLQLSCCPVTDLLQH